MMDEAFVSKIIVYPVKSLDGESVERSVVLSSGALDFDRRWAMFDSKEQYVNGKRYAEVHRIRSRVDLDNRTIELYWGKTLGPIDRKFSLDTELEEIQDWLSKSFEFPVSLRQDTAKGFPDDQAALGPTVISVATLNALAGWFELSTEEIRARFRTNIEIDGVPPFWEDHLYGRENVNVHFSIGDLMFEGVGPSDRCVVPTRDSRSGKVDSTFVRRFCDKRKDTLPCWAERSRLLTFYKLAINTRVLAIREGQSIKIGDRVRIAGRR